MCIPKIIKDKLFNEPELIFEILEELGCHKIKWFSKEEIRCALPIELDGETSTSVSVKIDENITTRIYSRNDFDGYDIIALVQYIQNYNFSKAKKWLCKKLNIDCNEEFVEEDFCLYKVLKKFKRMVTKKEDIITHNILNNKILNSYPSIPIQSWIDEGISWETQQKFGIRFDKHNNRILIPIYDEYNNLISIKGRTTISNFDELDIPKYIYYYKLGKDDTLYGLNLHKDAIQEKKEVILFEAEKSVMKTEEYGFFNTLGLNRKEINLWQLPKILKLNCDIVLALDKDVDYEEVRKEANKLRQYTNVSIIYDQKGLLSKKTKDSPVDRGKDIYIELYNSKIEVN